MDVLGPLQQIAWPANLALAVSILALTVARQIGSERPIHTRSWIFFGLAAGTLSLHTAFDLAYPTMQAASQIAETATIALLAIAFVFLYGGDREGIDRLQRAAERDGLTGLYDVRAFAELAGERLSRTVEHGGSCSVAIFDLDGFKELNDTQGHQAGDRMLQVVASALRANARPHDIPARYGGDEFVLLLDRCDAQEAGLVCDRILRSVELLSSAAGRQLTMSCGVSAAPENGIDLRDLIATADRQLLSVKRRGKNAVAVAVGA